jgi:hypothetical protein
VYAEKRSEGGHDIQVYRQVVRDAVHNCSRSQERQNRLRRRDLPDFGVEQK